MRNAIAARIRSSSSSSSSSSLIPWFEALEPRLVLSGGAGGSAAPVIDLLIAYTPAARAGAGSVEAIEAEAARAVDDANRVLANSLVDLSLRLVGVREVAYVESGDLDRDLDRLQYAGDGYLDEVHALRDELGADIVSLLVEEAADHAGLSYVLADVAGGADFAFNVLQRRFAAAPNYTLIHEIGHTLGLQHDREHASFAGAFADSYGHRFTGDDGVLYRDIMAYAPGERIPYFANPLVSYQGRPTGVALPSPEAADAARTLNITGALAAAFRPTRVAEQAPPPSEAEAETKVDPPTVEAVDAPDVGTSGGAWHEFAVTFASGRAIDAATIDVADVLVSGPRGWTEQARAVSVVDVGDGRVRATYRVAAPGGAWDVHDNGAYSITLGSGQVFDAGGAAVAGGTIGSFAVDLADVDPPRARLTADSVTTAGRTVYRFTVTYRDDARVLATSLGPGDVKVSGPNFVRRAGLVSITPDESSRTITATYRFSTPGGRWDGSDNGTYSVRVLDGQVRDRAGNAMRLTRIGAFEVAIPLTPPTTPERAAADALPPPPPANAAAPTPRPAADAEIEELRSKDRLTF